MASGESSGYMLTRLLKGILLLPLSSAVLVLIIIGLIDCDLLVKLTGYLIVATVIVGLSILIVKRLLFPE